MYVSWAWPTNVETCRSCSALLVKTLYCNTVHSLVFSWNFNNFQYEIPKLGGLAVKCVISSATASIGTFKCVTSWWIGLSSESSFALPQKCFYSKNSPMHSTRLFAQRALGRTRRHFHIQYALSRSVVRFKMLRIFLKNRAAVLTTKSLSPRKSFSNWRHTKFTSGGVHCRSEYTPVNPSISARTRSLTESRNPKRTTTKISVTVYVTYSHLQTLQWETSVACDLSIIQTYVYQNIRCSIIMSLPTRGL
jgi:hypothetical protein